MNHYSQFNIIYIMCTDMAEIEKLPSVRIPDQFLLVRHSPIREIT